MREGKIEKGSRSQRSRGFILALGLVAVVALLSWVALSAALQDGDLRVEARNEPSPDLAPLSLRLLHTNDTWGYTRPCG